MWLDVIPWIVAVLSFIGNLLQMDSAERREQELDAAVACNACLAERLNFWQDMALESAVELENEIAA